MSFEADWQSWANSFLRWGARHFSPRGKLRRRLARWWDDYLARRGKFVKLRIRGARLKLHPTLRSWNTDYEGAVLARFLDELRPGDVVWDLGAHFGIYAMLSARRVGARGKVRAWEPSARTFEILKSHVAENGPDERIVLVAEAIGDGLKREENFLTAPSVFEGGEMDRFVLPATATTRVPARSLDEWARTLGEVPDWIKMDIEGAEAAAVRGARELLRGTFGGRRPRILLSLHPRFLAEAGESVAELERRLRDSGYAIFDLQHRRASLASVEEYWLYPDPSAR